MLSVPALPCKKKSSISQGAEGEKLTAYDKVVNHIKSNDKKTGTAELRALIDGEANRGRHNLNGKWTHCKAKDVCLRGIKKTYLMKGGILLQLLIKKHKR